MENNLIIRNATPEDAKAIATIHVKTWQCAYKGQMHAGNEKWLPKVLNGEILC